MDRIGFPWDSLMYTLSECIYPDHPNFDPDSKRSISHFHSNLHFNSAHTHIYSNLYTIPPHIDANSYSGSRGGQGSLRRIDANEWKLPVALLVGNCPR